MSRVSITRWNRNHIGFTLRIHDTDLVKHRLCVMGFSRKSKNAFVLNDMYCVFKEDNYVLVVTHQDKLTKMYRLLSK